MSCLRENVVESECPCERLDTAHCRPSGAISCETSKHTKEGIGISIFVALRLYWVAWVSWYVKWLFRQTLQQQQMTGSHSNVPSGFHSQRWHAAPDFVQHFVYQFFWQFLCSARGSGRFNIFVQKFAHYFLTFSKQLFDSVRASCDDNLVISKFILFDLLLCVTGCVCVPARPNMYYI